MMGSTVPAGDRLKARVLAANLEALGIQGKSRQAILGAPSKGRLVRLPDGNPALEVEGRILGAPADAGSRASSLADVPPVSTFPEIDVCHESTERIGIVVHRIDQPHGVDHRVRRLSPGKNRLTGDRADVVSAVAHENEHLALE